MQIAITGASGFLGRYLVREMDALGHQCRGLIRPGSRHAGSKPSIEWVVGSFEEPEARKALLEGVDALVHAALDYPERGFLNPTLDVPTFVERNVVGTIRLIEAAKASGVGRVVIISSGAVHDAILDDRPLDETHPLWPRSHYGATKAAIEAFVHSYGRGEKLTISALRPTSIYGMATPLVESRWYNLIAAIVRGEDVPCRHGAKQVHAADVARAVGLLLLAEGVAGEVYHCTDLFIAERDVALLTRSIAGTHGRIDGESPVSRHPIGCNKLKGLGMSFGGESLLNATIAEMVRAIRAEDSHSVSP